MRLSRVVAGLPVGEKRSAISIFRDRRKVKRMCGLRYIVSVLKYSGHRLVTPEESYQSTVVFESRGGVRRNLVAFGGQADK
jgi:hypothetical protein